MDDQNVDELVARWVWWCETRRIFAPRPSSNVLARLQPRRRRPVEPDSFLDPAMPYLNMAIHSLCDQIDQQTCANAFLAVYWYRIPIKQVAYEMKCARGTVYNRARNFASRAAMLGKLIKAMHDGSFTEHCSTKIEQNSAVVD
ncbi:hypothetical protein J4G52_13195 [Burkholderia cenocepacia]|uniref:hypothetical protein n=1 Tax=Burkholderia TaxID=32008 RepID=UPI0012B7F606|nr:MULTISPECIES: hypothetical protein [Burkholderia]MBO1854495.1 hypothetical protein [Burkholderia cenocepacia]MDG0067947.1 hypothetical protein [Burkholderia sp. IO2]